MELHKGFRSVDAHKRDPKKLYPFRLLCLKTDLQMIALAGKVLPKITFPSSKEMKDLKSLISMLNVEIFLEVYK